jgi:hypothetical protein
MQHKLLKIKTVKFWKDKNTLFLVNEHGHMQIINANLIRHVLEIPYTKKDGTFVSTEQIQRMKQNPQPQQATFKKSAMTPRF